MTKVKIPLIPKPTTDWPETTRKCKTRGVPWHPNFSPYATKRWGRPKQKQQKSNPNSLHLTERTSIWLLVISSSLLKRDSKRWSLSSTTPLAGCLSLHTRLTFGFLHSTCIDAQTQTLLGWNKLWWQHADPQYQCWKLGQRFCVPPNSLHQEQRRIDHHSTIALLLYYFFKNPTRFKKSIND